MSCYLNSTHTRIYNRPLSWCLRHSQILFLLNNSSSILPHIFVSSIFTKAFVYQVVAISYSHVPFRLLVFTTSWTYQSTWPQIAVLFRLSSSEIQPRQQYQDSLLYLQHSYSAVYSSLCASTVKRATSAHVQTTRTCYTYSKMDDPHLLYRAFPLRVTCCTTQQRLIPRQ